MKPNHRDFSCWNHGNGLFHYVPNLSEKSTDFEDGVYAVKNPAPGKEGLNIIRDGEAEVIFEVFTPYIIVAKVNDLNDIKEIYKSSVPTWVNHWRYNWDTDILLDKPAEVVYVKFTGNPGLNTVRACLHLVDKRPLQTRIRVVHGYVIDGLPHHKAINLAKPTSYTVTCDGEPENTFIEISVPSN